MPNTHLLKPGTPLSAPYLRCGPLSEVAPGDQMGSEDGIGDIDCPGCLRGLVVDLRLKLNGRGTGAEALWLAGGDTGTSSITIWSVMTGCPVDRAPCTPYDAGDFGRCHRLLEQFPEWRERLPEVAAKHPAWRGLVGAWDELTALYVDGCSGGWDGRMLDRLRELLGAS